ncbi:hypothetical protein JG687_00006398, partial [Phytophthora cactorum]
QYPKVFYHGCVSHALHLVVKDLVRQLPWLKDPEQNCRQLQMDSKTTLVLPIDTHWETIERCFKSIKSSETILHGFVNSRDFLRSGSKEQKAKRRHADDMKAFQKNSKPPSEVYRMFLQLPKIYAKVEMTIAEYGKIAWILDDRFNFIYVNVHGVAYLLDPAIWDVTWPKTRADRSTTS